MIAILKCGKHCGRPIKQTFLDLNSIVDSKIVKIYWGIAIMPTLLVSHEHPLKERQILSMLHSGGSQVILIIKAIVALQI